MTCRLKELVALTARVALTAVVALWGGGWIVCEAWADDVQVNTYTTNDQEGPSIARGADGRFVVVWSSPESTTDPSDRSIQAQRYAADGSPAGGQFQVNRSPSYEEAVIRGPKVAIAPSGEFVIAWAKFLEGYPGYFDYGTVQAKRFASDGSPIGDEFQVNSNTFRRKMNLSMATGPSGQFVVAWHSYVGSFGSYDYDIDARLFASDGTPISGEFRVNSTFSDAYTTSVAMMPDGRFVIAWDEMEDGSDLDTFTRLYASDGSPLGSAMQITDDPSTYFDGSPKVASDADGDFIVAWGSSAYVKGSYARLRRFASDGTSLGDEIEITNESAGVSSVASDPDGNFIVLWASGGSSGTDTSEASVQARIYTSNGTPLTGEFQVNTYTTGNQWQSSVAMGPDGDYIVVWQSGGSHGTDTSGSSIQKTPGALIFADGFESGDTSAWSV